MALEQRAGDQRRGGEPGRDHAEAARPGQAVAQARGLGGEPVEAGERVLCPWQQRPSFGRQADVAPLAIDEPDAQLTLELADRCRERGLGDVTGFGGAAEVLLARECDEVLELAEKHPRATRRQPGSACEPSSALPEVSRAL